MKAAAILIALLLATPAAAMTEYEFRYRLRQIEMHAALREAMLCSLRPAYRLCPYRPQYWRSNRWRRW